MAKAQSERSTIAAAQGLNTVAAGVVAGSPELQVRIKAILDGMLDEVVHTMRHGSARERQALMRSVVPYLFRGFQDAQAAASSTEEAEAVQRILAMLRES